MMTGGPMSNPGLSKAKEAAAAVNGVVAKPAFAAEHLPTDGSKGPTDFNDLHQLSGLEAVSACIEEAITEDIPCQQIDEPAPESDVWVGSVVAGAENQASIPKPQTDESYPVIWLKDAKPHCSQAALIRGLIKPKSMVVIYGESNSGKTFFALDLNFHMATGVPWRGREVESGLVVYVAAEGSQSVENRVVAFRDELFSEYGTAPFVILPKPVDLLRAGADTDYVIRMIRQLESDCGEKCVFVVGDTLNRLMAGGNENSSEDMGALVSNADRIREEIGCTFAFIHHSGKDGAKGARAAYYP
ncbi:MAG: AAA family ATPase [gamma proteobacterium endosymbiont of Lamellibrachia anaximandri]|nr:AAA family ATPase [gamma proteobacterium endosymbiont of Lamellibrachia anaximandri]